MFDIDAAKEAVRRAAVETVEGKAAFGENFTRESLVEEMLDTLPDSVFLNPDLKWLDPCAGIGNFPIIVFERLMFGLKDAIPDDGLRSAHILKNMLFMTEIQEKSCDAIATVFGTDVRLHEGSFLEALPKDFPKSFDIILGNPPYERIVGDVRSAKNDNLWTKFIDRAMNLLKPDGYLLFITPPAWMSPSSKILSKHFLENQVLYLNIQECARHFKVGSKFSYYLIRKTSSLTRIETDFVCRFSGGKSVKPYTGSGQLHIPADAFFVPQLISAEVFGILEKTCFDPILPKFDVQYDSDLHRFTKKALLSDTQDEAHPYEIIHTPSQSVWSSRPHKNQGRWKVMIPLTTYYEQILISKLGNTQGMGYILVRDAEAAKRVKAVLSSELYRFIANITRWSNFNVPAVMKSLPFVNTDGMTLLEITDDFVYEALGLTRAERDFVHALMK